jgi:sporulation integral membrane protein YlbJ
MILFPFATYQGASSGLLLWFHNILPNLLPFIIISNLLIRLDIAKQISKIFYPVIGKLFRVSKNGCYPIILGFLSGIPLGAKSTADLVAEQQIDKEEGNFLFSMCNNASPMFIIGYIAITQLKLPQIKYALFAVIYASAVISALLLRVITGSIHKRNRSHNILQISSIGNNQAVFNPAGKPVSFSFDILDSSIMNGFEVITKIGGYIILFSILAQIVKEMGPEISFLKAFLMGILEITNGINQICAADLDINTKIVLVTIITSFGGFSGMAQTKSVINNTRLSIKFYFIAKLMNAFIAFLLILLYVTVF